MTIRQRVAEAKRKRDFPVVHVPSTWGATDPRIVSINNQMSREFSAFAVLCDYDGSTSAFLHVDGVVVELKP